MSENNVELRDFLKSHGYILGRKLGEGGFRKAYEVLKSKGTLQKLFVGKIYSPKKKNSVFHRISQSKDNLDQREVEILNGINHPNIIQLHDLLEENNMSITIEEHFDAISLEDKVRIQGPIQNQEFLKKVFSQATEALHYLHVSGEILHRDLKPSNILIGRRTDLVKVADFQTAALLSEVEKKILPTRGGTKYSHPDLINHLLAGHPSGATIATEFYALGATLFYALTGKAPFEYELNIVNEGVPLQIGDEKCYITLEERGKKLTFIAKDEHESKLEHGLTEVPVHFRELLTNCLSLKRETYSSLNAKEAHSTFSKDFQEAISREVFFIRPLEAMLRRELPLLQETKQPCFIDDDAGAIERMVSVAKQYGTRELKADVSSSGLGSDAQYKSISEELYVLADDAVRMELRDEVFHASDGTWSPGWWETYNRYLTVKLDEKVVLQAERRLEMESGNIHHDYGRQGALPWRVMNVEKLNERVKTLNHPREPADCWLEVPKDGKFDIDYIKENGYRIKSISGKTIIYHFYGQENESHIILEPVSIE